MPLTNDAPKYGTVDAAAKVLAILTGSGYVDSSAGLEEGAPLGLVLDTTSFYAGARREGVACLLSAQMQSRVLLLTPLLAAGSVCSKHAVWVHKK